MGASAAVDADDDRGRTGHGLGGRDDVARRRHLQRARLVETEHLHEPSHREVLGDHEGELHGLTRVEVLAEPREEVVVDARAPDGVVEGIEDPRRRFCLGVQWHPEFAIDPGDARIFAALIEAAR